MLHYYLLIMMTRLVLISDTMLINAQLCEN